MKPAIRAVLVGIVAALLLVAALVYFASQEPLDNLQDGDAAYPVDSLR